MLFLDEPTAGIDPVTRKQLWDDFYSLSADGKTLFVTTHYMEEAQRCNQLMFLSAGRAVARGTPDTIRKALGDVQMYTADIAYRPGLRAALLALDSAGPTKSRTRERNVFFTVIPRSLKIVV